MKINLTEDAKLSLGLFTLCALGLTVIAITFAYATSKSVLQVATVPFTFLTLSFTLSSLLIEADRPKLEKAVDFTISIVWIALDVAAILIVANHVQAVIPMYIFMVTGMLLYVVFKSSYSLMHSEDTKRLLFTYLLLSFFSILLMYNVFAILQTDANAFIYSNSNKSVESSTDLLYFTASAYYSGAAGDIIPASGPAKLWYAITVAYSAFVHVIAISFAIRSIDQHQR